MGQYLHQTFDALALFSGGLDSILAARLVQDQGIRVLGLHFVSPFFGHPDKLEEWEHSYGIPLMPVDVSSEFVHMLCKGPDYGTGKILNPCVDCKILMLNTARDLLGDFGAGFLISGEVLGQRPMSQRLDTLNIIKRDADVKNILVRALSARRLPPTDPEKTGLVDREKLGSMSGRGRKEQIKLARKLGISPIPTPAGGCLLTEKESAKRYLPLMKYKQKPMPADFLLANTGRQFWRGNHWLCIGRSKDDNDRLEELAEQSDYLFKLTFFPGPLGLGRPIKNQDWSPEILESAGELVSRFSPKARKSSRKAEIIIRRGETLQETMVWPGEAEQPALWQEPVWDNELAKTIHRAGENNPQKMAQADDNIS
ncbi:MAG: tRNA(5-methylaminomethyl-2-thiouridylate) methyltransferase [Desulfonatronovibrio sp.]